jgi:hypothetical protein
VSGRFACGFWTDLHLADVGSIFAKQFHFLQMYLHLGGKVYGTCRENKTSPLVEAGNLGVIKD